MKSASPSFGQWSGLLLLLIMGTLWGLQFAMLKLATERGLSEIGTLMIALVLLSGVFLVVMVLRKEVMKPTAKLLLFFIWVALLGYVIPLMVALYAMQHVPAGIVTLMATLSPVVTIIAATAFRSEKVSFGQFAAVVMGAVAVLLVFWPELESPDYGNAYWLSLALLIPLCYGIESVWIAVFWPRGLNSLQVVTGETIVAAFMVARVFFFFDNSTIQFVGWSVVELAVTVFVIAGVVESFIYFHLIERSGGVFVSFGNFVAMIAGIAWGILLFSEVHGVFVWFAVIAAMLSLLLATRNLRV